jgi:hypothetical protein
VAAQIFFRFQVKSLESEENFREILAKPRIMIRPGDLKKENGMCPHFEKMGFPIDP